MRAPKTLATLQLLAVLALGAMFADIHPASASPTAQELADGEAWEMWIQASTKNSANYSQVVGAHFVVTSENGKPIGDCTIKYTDKWGCEVDVPSDRISLVWEDLDSIPAGYAPEKNPVVFDPTTYVPGPHHIGASFVNVPTDGNAETGSGSATSTSTGSDSPTSPSAAPSETTSTTPSTIGAMSCENSDRNCWGEIGTHFTVTTEDGEYLGECMVEELGTRGQARCNVPVPAGIVVVVTEDVTTITPGFAPESNPITFDTAVEPIAQCASCDWGPTFANRPKAAGTDSSVVPETRPLIIWASSCDDSGACADAIGAHFTVTTEDGDPVGECILEDLGAGPALCGVPVPVGGVVIVTEDVSTIPPGLAPESNPIRFDTTLEAFDQCAPCHWGPDFRNGPKTTSTGITSSGTVTSSTSDSTKTWTASVQVSLCDAPPNSGQDMNCHGMAGVVATISLASGEILGSCTSGEPVQFPGGDMISLCSVDGLPFNADLVATQDPSTIPTGYVPYSNSLTLHVDDLTPGGGDSATFTFFDVRADAGSSGATGASSGSMIEDFIVGCVPAEACYNATITITTQDGEFITSFTCPPPPSPVSSWICLVPNVPRGIQVVLTLDNIAPGYVVEQNPLQWDTTIEPTAGPVGERPIFRFGKTEGSPSDSASTSNESATILLTFLACPEGFDSNAGDFFAECTIPLDAPDAAVISQGGDGQGGMNITQLDRQNDGAYIYPAGSGTMNVQFSGLAPVVRNGYQVFGADGGNGSIYTVNLANGETREISIFYYQ